VSGILVLVVLVPVPTILVISGFWSCFSESIVGSEETASALLSLFSFFLSTFFLFLDFFAFLFPYFVFFFLFVHEVRTRIVVQRVLIVFETEPQSREEGIEQGPILDRRIAAKEVAGVGNLRVAEMPNA